MKSHIIATIGSIVGGFVAALCCIGPVVLAGAGAAGMFAGFWDYRPYVIPVVLILLGISFYYAYRIRDVECDDGTCKIESAGKWNKIGVWVSTVVVVLLILFPYIGFVPAGVFDETTEPTTEVVISIDGMTCASCATAIKHSLAGAKGISDTKVSYPESVGIIKIDEHLISIEELVEKVSGTGFTVTGVDIKNISND